MCTAYVHGIFARHMCTAYVHSTCTHCTRMAHALAHARCAHVVAAHRHLIVQLGPRLVRVDDQQLELARVRVDVPRLEARAHVVQQVGFVESQQLQVVHLGAALVGHRDAPPRHLGRLATSVAPTHDAAAAIVAERDHARRREGLGSWGGRLELDPGDDRTVGCANLNPHLDVDHHLLRLFERLHLDPFVHQHARLSIDTSYSAHSAARLRKRLEGAKRACGARVGASGSCRVG